MFLVAVTDHVSTCLYGPFESKEKAEKWVKEHKNDFFGRSTHVIRNEAIKVY